jgi:MFS transporter, FSR family, fosmidomycin resistance protein
MIPIGLRAARGPADIGQRHRRRVLWVTCTAHALHDGFTDTLYLLLPLWQAEFALGYAAVGALRSLYTAAMAGLHVPAAMIARRIGNSFVLAVGTMLAAAGYLLAGSSSGFLLLAAALILGGIGSSTQHPIASNLVAQAYDAHGSRAALATYNFAGDLGKMALPAVTGLALLLMPWRSAALVLGVIGMATALAIAFLLNASRPEAEQPAPLPEPGIDQPDPPRGGFALLLAIGIIDSATRMGFLTFLPFLLKAKGASLPTVGLALMLVFAGGAAGKLVCGFLGARIGVLATVVATEGVTALGIATLLPLPLEAILALLPAIGVALNGTSSVLYGTVPELTPAHQRQRAFGLFYTGTIGAGALSPAIYGLFGDIFGHFRRDPPSRGHHSGHPALGLEAELGAQRREVGRRASHDSVSGISAAPTRRQCCTGKPIASAIISFRAGVQANTGFPRRNPSLARKSLIVPPASSTSRSPASASQALVCNSQ